MRQGGPDAGQRFLKCGRVKCAVASQRQIADQFLLVSERPCLEEMVGDLSGALVGGVSIELLDRVGDAGVQELLAGRRDAGEQRLTNEFMGEGERCFRLLGTRGDYSHLLRLLDDGEKFVN